MQYVTATWRL